MSPASWWWACRTAGSGNCLRPRRSPISKRCTWSATCRRGCNEASPSPFRFRDAGALVSLSHYNAFGTLGRFGLFRARFVQGQFARASHALLYRLHQLSVHGPLRAALLWIAERINALVQPSIRIT